MSFLRSFTFKKGNKLKLEFCENNLDRFLDGEAFLKLQVFIREEKAITKEYKCLNQCEICSEKPYVKANGQIIVGNSPADLLEKLRNFTKSNKKEA